MVGGGGGCRRQTLILLLMSSSWSLPTRYLKVSSDHFDDFSFSLANFIDSHQDQVTVVHKEILFGAFLVLFKASFGIFRDF